MEIEVDFLRVMLKKTQDDLLNANSELLNLKKLIKAHLLTQKSHADINAIFQKTVEGLNLEEPKK